MKIFTVPAGQHKLGGYNMIHIAGTDYIYVDRISLYVVPYFGLYKHRIKLIQRDHPSESVYIFAQQSNVYIRGVDPADERCLCVCMCMQSLQPHRHIM